VSSSTKSSTCSENVLRPAKLEPATCVGLTDETGFHVNATVIVVWTRNELTHLFDIGRNRQIMIRFPFPLGINKTKEKVLVSSSTGPENIYLLL